MSSTKKSVPTAKDIPDIVAEFRRDIKWLVKILLKKHPNDHNVIMLDQRLYLGLEADPLLVMREAGNVIFKYRQHIKDKNDTFLLQQSFDEELSAAKDKKDVDFGVYLIDIVKQEYQQMNVEEKALIWEKISNLLRQYCRYKIASK